jgi:iron-sulfur cluster assembly protein
MIGIKLTPTAVPYILDSLSKRENSLGIRFGVKGAGCSGYSYVVEYVYEDSGEDHIFLQDGVNIFVDKKAILLLDGMEVNFVEGVFSSGLEFKNPLASQSCGCGESFRVE